MLFLQINEYCIKRFLEACSDFAENFLLFFLEKNYKIKR